MKVVEPVKGADRLTAAVKVNPPGRRRVVMTGGSGRIGSRVLAELLMSGAEVLALVRAGRATALPSHPGLSVIELDEDDSSLARHLNNFRADICMHLATSWVPAPRVEQIASMIEANIALGIRVAEGFARAGGSCFINAASYFQRRGSVERQPVNAYAAMKNAFEEYLRWRASCGDLRVLNLEVHDTYAPADSRTTVWSQLMSAAQGGYPFRASPGDQVVAPLHIDDAAAGFLVAADLVLSQTSDWLDHHVAGSHPLSLREALQVFIATIGINVDIEWGARPYSGSEIFDYSPVGAPLPRWTPRWTLQEGLAAVWAARCADPTSL